MRPRQARPLIEHCARLLAAIAAAGCLGAIAGCASAPPAGPGRPTAGGGDDEAWVIRGSVTGGPIIGNPRGPYSPR